MSNKEGQHFVSRFYLKGFQDSTAPGEVWLHKLGKTPRRFSTRAICKRPWYYSLKNEDGTWDSSIEDFLGKFVESSTATVLNKEIDHKSVPSEAGKQYLAIFLAFLKHACASAHNCIQMKGTISFSWGVGNNMR
jgi:hypothetical protein